MRWLVLFLALVSIGCTVPDKIKKDVALVQSEEQLLYDFNQRLLKSLKTNTDEEMQKKLDLMTLSRIVHHRVKTGTDLLAEYLESTEYLSNEQANIGDSIIDLIRQVREKITTENQ